MTESDKNALMKNFEFAKDFWKVVGELSTTMFVCGIARAVLPPQVNLIVKGGALIGGFLLSGIANQKVDQFIDEAGDDLVKFVEETHDEIKRCVDVIQDKDIEEEKS